jgi:hypothetical protein
LCKARGALDREVERNILRRRVVEGDVYGASPRANT